MQLTVKEVENMPAGEALNALILEMVFKATPITDDEFRLLRATWLQTMPSWTGQRRPMKGELTGREIEELKYQLQYARYSDNEIFPTYRLMWPQKYSEDSSASPSVIHRMRSDGWLYEFAEMDEGKIKSVRFKRLIWNEYEFAGEIIGHAFGGTDELAICRAAIVSVLMLQDAIARGRKTEGGK